jgi:membrane fusion protein, multidrug efflux system
MSNTRTLIAAAFGVSAAACAKPIAQKSPIIPVQVATVGTISAPLTIIANGVVEPLHTVAIQAQVGGTIQEVAFSEGAEVESGQILFKLDPRPYEAALRQAEAALARDEAMAQNAAREADRYKALVEKDYVTKSQADQATSTATSMVATVQSDRANVDNAKLNLAYTTIRAPIAGRTGRLLVRQGNLARPNADPLVVINELHPILVRFPVLQHDFPALQRRQGQSPVSVRVVTADSGKVGDVGKLAFLDNTVDSLTGSVTAKARFDNQTRALWPGEYVGVSVELDVQPNVLAIPTKALQGGQQGDYVFIVGADKVAAVREVVTGRAVGDMTIVSKGLKVGEQVVVDGQSRLTPNAKVDAKSAPTTETATTKGMP